jgi:hypothetical protein
MSNVIKLSDYTDLHLLGTRFIARTIRGSIEHLLLSGNAVLDFSGIEVTQSFVDELIGPLVLSEGPDLLRRLAFSHCTENAQAIIRFVVSSRLADYAERHADPGRSRPHPATA